MRSFYEKKSVSLYLSKMIRIEKFSSKANKKIELYIHPELGKVLVINDEIQHIEAWASFYHETAIHLPASFVKRIERVLILGGGSLFAAFEFLKYKSVKEIILVDFDSNVIELSTKHYSHAKLAVADSRLRIINSEAFAYLETNSKTFDFIFNDSIDLYTQTKRFTKQNAFLLLAKNLTKKGVCSDLVYRHIYESKTSKKTVLFLTKNFNTAFSLMTVPEYPGIMHLLSIWGHTKKINQQAKKTINQNQIDWINGEDINPLKLFEPKHLTYYLYLPPYLKFII